MKPTAEIEEKGLKAYEQARAFERLRSWRLPVSYAVFVTVPFLSASVAWVMGRKDLGAAQYGAAVLFAVIAFIQWRHLKGRYAKNREIVAELERTYGDDLPWVQVNRHLAQLKELREEMARVKSEETA